MRTRLVLLISCGLMVSSLSNAQSSLQVIGNPVLAVNTAAGYQNGVTITHSTLRVSVSANLTYNLQVRATGNMVSGINQIPIGQMRLRVTNIAGANAGVALTTVYQSLGSARVAAAVSNQTVTIEYKLAGGQNILRPAGAYVATLNFLLTAQ